MKKYKEFIKEGIFDKFKKDDRIEVHYNGFTANKSHVENGKFIKGSIPKDIRGYFHCYNLGLTSLENGPIKVLGEYSCYGNKLTNLEHIAIKVGSLIAGSNLINSLEFFPNKVENDIHLYKNKLTSLKGICDEINGNLYINQNELTSFKFGPSRVEKNINCQDNPLTSLEFAPKYVGGVFEREFNGFLDIESRFVEGYFYKNDYYQDLYDYCKKFKRDLNKIKHWPEEFVKTWPEEDRNYKDSGDGIAKFGL